MQAQPKRGWQALGRTNRMVVAGSVLLLLLGLALLAGWLRGADDPLAATAQRQTIQAGELTITLQLDDAALGARAIDVLVADAAGRPADADAVRLRFSMAEMAMAAAEAEAQPLRQGHFQARGSFFTMAGRWAIEAIVMRDAQPPVVAAFAFPIAAPGEAGGPLNPLAADAPTIAAGRLLYQANCASCHGVGGKGDGPLAIGLRPLPGDFTQHMLPGKHTEGQAFLWIKNGFPNSAMPAWGQRLPDEQIWQLVTFLRTLAQPSAPASAGQATAAPFVDPTAVPMVAEPLPPLIFTRAGNLWRSDGSARPPQQLTRLPNGSYAEYPAVSPSGDQVAFVATSQGPLGPEDWPQLNPETRLMQMSGDGSAMQLLWDPERGVLGQPAWAPDGQAVYVAFADVLSPPGAPVADRLFQIVRVDLATKARTVALENAYDLWFSRDGQMVVFLRWHKEQAGFTLNVAAPDGTGERELVGAGAFSHFASPRFSPDGRQILFVALGGPPTDPQGKPIARLDQSPLDALLGLFAPAAAEAHEIRMDFWMVNADGTGLRRLVGLREDTPMGAFAPDGARIAVMGAGGIYLLNSDGSNIRKLDQVGDHGGLDWAQR